MLLCDLSCKICLLFVFCFCFVVVVFFGGGVVFCYFENTVYLH